MFATLRWYGGNAELADQLAARGDEVKAVISAVEGVRGYYLVRTDGGRCRSPSPTTRPAPKRPTLRRQDG